MKELKKILLGCGFLFLLVSCKTNSDQLSNPTPSPRQLEWQQMEYYAFIHFSINSFTDKEWGYGDESPSMFNPSDLDTDQWAKTISEAGMKGIIITAKHHDGFCLWPSKYSEHSVKNSPWKDGNGDLVKELSESCKKYGLKMGVYLSPWDRNHGDYGSEAYLEYYRNQLRELLTQYGPIFEVWFDGANGGDGYYGGANQERKVDKRTYYNWPSIHKLVRELQPNAVMFSDAGPDIRWVGNEKGYANQTTWSTIYLDSVYAGMPDFNCFSAGQKLGTHWVPTETDVSIRPGWFYHQKEDDQVKTVDQLWDIYCNSIGLNSNLLLNIPVDRRGLIHPNDSTNLIGFGKRIKTVFAKNLMGDSYSKSVENLTDKNIKTYVNSASPVELEFKEARTANLFVVRESIIEGQSIESFELEIRSKGQWETIYSGTTIGNKRIIRFDRREVSGVRFNVINSKAAHPKISEMGLYFDVVAK